LLVAAILFVPPCFGQSSGYAIEDMVITARKREENLQDTPVAVSAFNENELRYRQIRTTDQLAEITPNLTFDQASPSSGSSSAGQIFIRGVGQTDFTPVTDPGVGLSIDGIYMARSAGNVLDFVDIDRVEVLRGPQGTLFGRNTIGGAIVVHTRRPDPEALSGSITGKIGDDSLINVTGRINVPLAENAAVNFAVDAIQRDGYVTRINDGIDTGDRDRVSLRGALTWDITDSFDAFMTLDYSKIDENGAPTVSGGVNDTAAFGTFGNGLLASCTAISINPAFPVAGPPSFPPPGVGAGGAPGCFGPDKRVGNFSSEGTFPVQSELDIWGLGLELEWEINHWLTIRSITGYREMEMFTSRDGDNTPMNVFATQDDFEHEQVSQELQFINSFFDDTVQSLIGFYYFQEEGKNLNPVTLPVGAIQSGGFYDNDSVAAFWQGTWDATDALAFTLGIRYTEDTKQFTPDQFSMGDASMGPVPGFFGPTWPNLAGIYLAASGPMPAGTRILRNEEFKATFDDTNVLANVAYRFTDAVMAYFTYSTGYKSGGFDQRFAAPTPDMAPSTFQPEEVDSYELGLKSDLFDNKLRVNLAIFHTDYDNQHIIVRETFNPITFNAGKSEIDGGELELTWVPTEQWFITAAVGYLDASYKELSQGAQNSGVLLENSFVNTPEWTSSVGVAYSFDIGQWGTLTPRVDWSYRAEEYNDAVNTPQLKQDSFSLVNAAIVFNSADDHWEAILGGRNLTDEDYLITGNSAFTTAASYVEQVYGRPREWWISLEYGF
ncbi:MAG: TonB-dependent receptor, partial [Gammaproteobacteria bacterium]